MKTVDTNTHVHAHTRTLTRTADNTTVFAVLTSGRRMPPHVAGRSGSTVGATFGVSGVASVVVTVVVTPDCWDERFKN